MSDSSSPLPVSEIQPKMEFTGRVKQIDLAGGGVNRQALAAQRRRFEELAKAKGEAEAGQEELNVKYSDALDTADMHTLVKMGFAQYKLRVPTQI